MVILGISIGTRTSGIAIISNRGLISWNTLSFKNSWSEQKADRIIGKYEKYLKNHKVTVVVLKIPQLSHHTEAILILLKKLEELFTYHGCMVEYKTKAELKQAIPEMKNIHDLMTYTAEKYPILQQELNQELKNKNKYYDRMFEAVLVAHLQKSKPSQ